LCAVQIEMPNGGRATAPSKSTVEDTADSSLTFAGAARLPAGRTLSSMKRALALAAVAVALGTAVAGCRNAPEARQPQRPQVPAVQTSPAPKPAQQSGTATGGSSAVVSNDLSDVDKMLQEMDDQLAKADASPADGD
jgi:hypothetical protein